MQFRIFISWIHLGYCSCVWKALPRALQETSNVGTPCHQSKSDVCERHLYRYPQITFLSSLLVPRTFGFTTRKPIVLSNITSVRCVSFLFLLLIAFMVVVVVGFRLRPLWTRWAPTICKNGVITSLNGLISGFSWGYFTPINAAIFAPTVTTGDFNTGHALQIPCVSL